MKLTVICLALLAGAGVAAAAGPELPPPVVEADLLPSPLLFRVSAYEVWQNRAVNRRGYFVARVIQTPFGPVYRYNGEPYLTPTTKQLDYMPYASD